MIDPQELMQLAIDRTREGIAMGQSPFGCAIAVGDEVVAVEHNTVWTTTDITAHAEVTVLRAACRTTGRVLLEGAIAATTCEPCPMCMTALHWARVDTVYFGADIQDAADAGFNELQVSAQQMISIGGSNVKLVPGLLVDQCRQLFRDWIDEPKHRAY